MATAPVTVTANLNFNPASLNAAGKQVQSAFGNINLPTKAANNFNNSLGRITGQASEFDKSINAATARVFAFGAAVSIVNGISTAFKALVSSTIEVEKRLTEISSILGGSVQQLNQFKTAIFDVAKNTGQTFATVADGASELARQGLSAEETVKRLNAALILTRVSGLDAEGSVNALTSAINGFTSAGLTAEQIVNKLIAVDTAFAVSAKDLAEAFSRAGSTAEDAGVSFDELLGLVTSVQQTTARGGAVIGNAFKSIFSRLSRGTVIDDLQALGVEINASQTGVQKLQALSNALSRISDPTQANAIKELAGGVYQINVVSAALKDLSSETSIFGQASQTASQASNEAFEKNAQLNQTLASQINKLVQGLTELGSKIGELSIAPVIENLLTGANKLLDILNKVFDPEEGNKLIQGFFKGVGAFIAGPGLVLVSAAFFKLFQVVAKFAKEGISDLFKIGSEQERIKNIEGGIVALLQQDAKLRATLLSSSTSQAQKEQAVINSIKQQNALLAQQQALVNSIAVASAKAGVGGFSPSGGFTKRKGKGMFAAGYKAEEAMAKGLGASSKVKAQISEGTIDGKKFIKNSEEIEIPNFAGGRDSAVIPLYARGFIPNFNGKYLVRNPRLAKTGIIRKNLEDYPNGDLYSFLKDANKGETVPVFLNGEQKRVTKEEIEEAIKKRANAKLLKKEEDANRVGSPENLLLIKAEDYAMLIPNLNYGYYPDQEFGVGSIDKWQNIKNLNYRLSPTQLAGPNTDLKITEQEETSIAKEAMENIISTAISYSQKLSNPLMDQPIGRSEIYEKLKQGGNKGSYGAVQGAAGAAFEAVITQGLGLKGEAGQPEGGDWDAKSVPNKLKELFGITKKVRSADFKVSKSKSSIESYAKKILNDEKDDYKKLLGIDEKEEEGESKTPITAPKKGRGRRRAASGFIPNFAALNDAISREMAAGIPRDKIYVDQNNSLKSPFNTEGLMVANRDDEPNGGKQGIKRAISEGKNPKTYGQNFAARGFIPNYAAGVGLNVGVKLLSFFGKFGDDILKFGAKSSKTAKSLNTLGEAAEGAAKQTKLGKLGDLAKQEGKSQISNIASLSLFSLIPQLAFNLEGLKKDINDFGNSVSGVSEVLKEEISFREGLIGNLEKERSKEKPDQSKIKEIEAAISSSQDFSNKLEKDSMKIEKSTLLLIEEFTGLASFLNGIGAFSNKDLEQLGPRGEELANESTTRKLLQPFLTMSLGDPLRDFLYKFVGQNFEDSGTGTGMSVKQYNKYQEANIRDLEQQLKIKLEAREIRKEIDRVKELFEKETVSFKFDVKNVRSQLERIIDDVSIGGRTASVERAGNITELQKKASNYQFGAAQNDSSLSVADQRYMARKAGEENLRLDQKQSTRQDQLIQQKSADTFGDLFTKLTGNLNSSGSGTALLERERAMSDLNAAKGALAGSSPENQESAQQRVDQLTEKLSQIDSNIASRKDTAVDPTFEGEIQRARLQKIQGAASALTTGSEIDQKQALEDIFKNLEGLNLGGGGAEIKQEILDAAKEVSAERTAIFIDQEKTRLTNELDLLEKEKSILDQFISDFNSSFAENIKGTRDSFNTLTKNQRPVTQNAAALTGARIGQGETTNSQIISDRLNAANRVTQTFDGANFSNLVGQEDLATFRSNTASQIVSGGKLTALEDINEKVAGNLRNTIEDANFNDQETSSIKQVAKGSLEGISSNILNRATGTGDTELAARAQELQDVLSDPEAGISQILQAVEGLNIDSSKLSEEVQTALQEQIAIALGTIGGQTRSVEGAGAVNESKDVSAQINDFSQSLSNLTAVLDDNIPEVKFPEIVKTLESNTDLLQTAIGSLTTKFDGLDQASKGLEESLATFKKTVDSFKGNEDKDKEKLTAMAEALEAVKAATKSLKSDNSGPKK
jgi:TP901 family phage tail tape measure protein